MPSYTYIMANKKNGTLYVGVTADLKKRVYEHRAGLLEGFTKRYQIKMLVYYEMFNHISLSIKREKQIKNYKREWKIELIEAKNKDWRDLYEEII